MTRSWRVLARRVLCSRLCRHDGQPAPTRLEEITDLDVEQLIEAGRPGDAAVAGRMLPGLARLHGYGFVVDVAAVRAANLQSGDDVDITGMRHGTAKAALNSCISGEGEPPLRLMIAAVACAGSGVICGIPVQQMREDSVTKLNLSNRGIRSSHTRVTAAMLVAHLLPATSVLKNLSIAYNEIDREAAQQLAAAALGSSSLELLSEVPIKELREDKSTELKLEGKGLGVTEGIVLAKLIKVNGALTSIDLSGNQLCSIWFDLMGQQRGTYTAEGITAIADALRVNAVLTNLRLDGNNIGVDGAKAIAKALKANAVLTVLNLIGNNIGVNIGAKAIGEALKVNAVLTTLSLRSNKIGDKGAKAIAEGLKSGTAVLTELGLGSNKIGDQGAKAIAEALKSGTAVLTNLELLDNNIGDDGAKAIAEAARH